MKLRRTIATLALMAFAAAQAVPAASADTVRLGLRAAVDRAVSESHLVRAGDFDVAKAGEGLRKARAQR
jgi:hypothetical protein